MLTCVFEVAPYFVRGLAGLPVAAAEVTYWTKTPAKPSVTLMTGFVPGVQIAQVLPVVVIVKLLLTVATRRIDALRNVLALEGEEESAALMSEFTLRVDTSARTPLTAMKSLAAGVTVSGIERIT
jgi:hypothetical protein